MKQNYLSKGNRVTLHSLKTIAMNDKNGELMSFLKDEGRWAVKIDGFPNRKDWKKIKPQNLKIEDTVGVVVIPPEGDIYYTRLPTTSGQAFLGAIEKRFKFGGSHDYYHYYNLPTGDIGWMTMAINDMFVNTKPNLNLEKLGWNSNDATYIEGTVVIYFSSDLRESEEIFFYEPYELNIVKMLVRELAEARTRGHPTRERMIEGIYKSLPLMPHVFLKI